MQVPGRSLWPPLCWAVSVQLPRIHPVCGASLRCWTAKPLWGYADAPGLGGTLVYLSAENLSAHTLPVAPSYLQGRAIQTQEELYHTGSGLSVCCDGQPVPCGSFAAPLYNENAADASLFTLNLAAGRGAMIHCFCKTPDDWQQLELRYQPAFAAGQSVCFAVRRGEDAAALGPVPASPAELATLVDL